MNKINVTKLSIITSIGIVVAAMIYPCVGQSSTDAALLFQKVSKIRLFEHKPKDLRSIVKYTTVNRPEPKGRFGQEQYEFGWGRITIIFSTGKCSTMNSKLGYDLEMGIVTGVNLFFYKPYRLKTFGFNLERFRIFEDNEGGSITYTDERAGIVLSGNKRYLVSIDREPSEMDEDKYHCSNAK